MNFLQRLLQMAQMARATDVFQLLISEWAAGNLTEDVLPLTSKMFLGTVFTDEVLQMLIEVDETITFINIIDDIQQLDASPAVIVGCERLNTIFGKQSYSTYKSLHADLEQRQKDIEDRNQAVFDFLTRCMEETSPPLPKPVWIKLFADLPENKEELQQFTVAVAVTQLPEPRVIAEIMTGGLGAAGIGSAEEIGNWKIQWEERARRNELTAEERQTVLTYLTRVLRAELSSHDDLARVYGPSHPPEMTELNDDPEFPCSMHGGCRMFLCVCLENVDNEFGTDPKPPATVEWFRGSCDKCHGKIEHKHYAVRKPIFLGGWLGCYCSWDCIRKDMGTPSDLGTVAMIDAFEKKVLEVGIQDRN